jgi:hypothetical protein
MQDLYEIQTFGSIIILYICSTPPQTVNNSKTGVNLLDLTEAQILSLPGQ